MKKNIVEKQQIAEKTIEKKLEGISGWLIVPIVGLFLTIIACFDDILFITSSYYMDSFILILILLDIFCIVFSIVCLISIFNRKKYVRKLMILYYIVFAIVGICLGSFYSVITLIIWGSYFRVSERGENTFVN